ncbi:amidohydrolase family protein [Marinilactibacillus psychrotolerans]|uniref:amidohydrolase family protein n=1 Tax=Marinilactibacillus psychrotolerans TaxID=191770 RepID=UPI003886234B
MSKVIIKNGQLIDGNGGIPIEKGIVVIEENLIVFVGNEGDYTDEVDEIIDVEGGTIVPGFIDTHVHMMMEYSSVQSRLETPFSYKFYQAIEYMKKTLDAGITSVRDALGTDLGVKKAVEDGIVEGPRMQLSINALTITGVMEMDIQLQDKRSNCFKLVILVCLMGKQMASKKSERKQEKC